MANIPATQSGDFSASSTWAGGVVPSSGDVAFSNNFTVTISDARTVQAVSNASGTGITAGGTFSLLNGCALTCTNANGVVQGATATSCVTTPNLSAGSSASVTAQISHTVAQNNCSNVSYTGGGTLNLTGNLTGGSLAGTSTFALYVQGTGTVNITGNITGGGNGGAGGMFINTAATVNITGNVTGGGALGLGITMSNGTVTVIGNVTGAGSAGIQNNGSTTLTVNGACQSSSTAPAIAAGSATQITRLSGPFLLGATGGINPIQAISWRWSPTQVPTYFEVLTSGGSTKRNLFTSDNIPTANYPPTSAVRSGTVYGPSNENTGTLAVPSASSVALGVPVDNTVGTAVLTEQAVRSAIGIASANLDTQLANKATVDQVAAIVQGAVSQ